MRNATMKLFLEPRSLALIGVSRHTGDGTNVLENLLSYGYPGKLYPVNPNASEILGVKCYPTILDIPDTPDLAVLYTPRALVTEGIRQCAQKGIKAAAVIAQGFADADTEGKVLQQEMVRAAREGGVRIIGPNSFGVANAFLNLNTAFVRFELQQIPLATIAQSGLFFGGGSRMKFVGKAIDLGNACDLGFAEVLEHFGTDPEIKVIALYLEGVQEGRKFLETARGVTARKPVIVLKGGRTSLGARTVLSHTGSLAGKDEVYAAAFRQCGIILADNLADLEDLVSTFWLLPPPPGKRLGILAVSMGTGVMAIDACARHGLTLASLSSITGERIARHFPPWLHIGNPVDTGMAPFTPGGIAAVFREATDALMEDPQVDALLVLAPSSYFHPEMYNLIPNILQVSRAHPHKPLLIWINMPDEQVTAALRESQLAVYPTIEQAVKCLSRLADYAPLQRETSLVTSR